MASDVDQVLGGPADFTVAATSIGHTQGGITCTVSPQNRPVTVDQFGVSECNIRHTGDEFRANVPFAEWTATALGEIYNPGRDQLTGSSSPYLGIGRSAGYIYTPAECQIVPHLTADAGKKVVIYRGVPIGDVELAFNNDDDRIMEVEFAGLVDESKTDGELIAKFQLSA